MSGLGNCKVVEKLKSSVQERFAGIRKAVEVREKLLLRQIDVIASQSSSSSGAIEEIYFIPENEKDLLTCLRTFGKFNLDNLNFSNDLYTNEDYIAPSIDHHLEVKTNDDEYNENEEIIVNFSNNKKLIKDNVNNINESIIHITLNEAKELIEKSKANTNNLYQIITSETTTTNCDKGLISQSSQTNLKSKRSINPNITINNCNGTINLKNISNLTINCVTQDSFNIPDSNKQSSIESNNSHQDDHQEQEHDQQEEQQSFNNSESDIIQSDDANTTKDSENNSVNCEFYDRLISEIRHSLKQSQKAPVEQIPLGRKAFDAKFGRGKGGNGDGSFSGSANDNNDDGNDDIIIGSSNSTTNTTDSYNRKFLLKNFENLKIVLENNENDTHPVQIEQWLTEIISETEIEPMQNTDILEHSGINSNE